MQLPRLSFATAAMAASFAVSGWAQQQAAPATPPATPQPQFKLQDYSKPELHFPNPLGPYMSRQVVAPNLGNTPRLNDLMKDGKIMLSLNDVIALALENNLDIAIARYNLNIADTDILRARAGSATRGVNTGLVQGTPGGNGSGVGSSGSGSGAGGTTTGSGGAGSGTSGLVTSTAGVGSPVSSFDPVLIGTFQLEHATFNVGNTVTTGGAATIRQNTGSVNWAYQQGFQTGTNLSLSFDNSRQATTNPRFSFNPQVTSSFRFTLSQHLLQGFGFLPNQRFIRVAKNNREISDVAFRLQVITTVTQMQNIYWDLVNAYEDVKVKERSVALADKTLSDNKKQVDIGTLAPIEIVRAESEGAARKQDLIVSQTNLQLQQLLMKNAISRNLTDATLADADVIPTDTMQIPEKEAIVPTQDLVADALAHRAELAESRIDLTNRQINNKAARNALLPSLDLFAFYGGSGLGGNTSPACVEPGPGCRISYGGTVGQLFDSTAPDKGAGLQLTIPLRNRAAQADQVRAQLEYRQAEMRLQQLENQIRIEVRNAQFALLQNRARVEAAKAGVALAQQSLDAEQKKFALGASTNTLVLQSQRDLAQSASNLVAANAAYEKSRVELDRVTGLTLTHLGIELADAETGQVRKQPSAPGVMPRAELQASPQQ